MKKRRIKFKTVIISDVHLGAVDSKAKEVSDFLSKIQCEKLILNGDIIDGWHLKRRGSWKKAHTHFIRLILKKIEKEKTKVIYLRGNHDDILERFLPLTFGNLQVVDEYLHETPRGDYLVLHGDGFDSIATDHKWMAVLGSLGYNILLRLNRLYNKYRRFRGKDYFSISKLIKAKVKSAVSFINKYEDQLQSLARKRKCYGIICGHIHTPANKMIHDVHYLNSGDWVESLTAIVENVNGNFEVISYEEFLETFFSKKENIFSFTGQRESYLVGNL